MASKATVYKVELQISDMDRHYYATHAFSVAQHPSETAERLMTRVLAFAMFADDALQFGRGLSSDDEPDLWRKSLTGEIEQWIDLGQPDESRIRRACGRARSVVVITYSGRSADLWWEKTSPALTSLKQLSVVDIPLASVQELAGLAERGMKLQCLIQDGTVQVIDATTTTSIEPLWRKRAER